MVTPGLWKKTVKTVMELEKSIAMSVMDLGISYVRNVKALEKIAIIVLKPVRLNVPTVMAPELWNVANVKALA